LVERTLPAAVGVVLERVRRRKAARHRLYMCYRSLHLGRTVEARARSQGDRPAVKTVQVHRAAEPRRSTPAQAPPSRTPNHERHPQPTSRPMCEKREAGPRASSSWDPWSASKGPLRCESAAGRRPGWARIPAAVSRPVARQGPSRRGRRRRRTAGPARLSPCVTATPKPWTHHRPPPDQAGPRSPSARPMPRLAAPSR
jgi:hypothetical protein